MSGSIISALAARFAEPHPTERAARPGDLQGPPGPADSTDATRLTAEQLGDLRASARKSGSGPFIDPAAFRVVQETHFYPEWASAVLGRTYVANRLDPWEIKLLALALAAEPDRPTPAAVQARRDAARREEEEHARAVVQAAEEREAAWRTLRESLPVPVTVGHNWTVGHYDGHVTGKDHIVVQAELHVGRLHREQYAALCETPSKMNSGTPGYHRNPLNALDRRDDGEDRIPTCAACLKIANRVTGSTKEPPLKEKHHA